MSSSYSDKPYSNPPNPEMEEAAFAEPLSLQKPPPRLRINLYRLFAGFIFLFILTGALLLCFVPGGLVNQFHDPFSGGRYILLNHPGHIIGFVLLGIGAVGIVLFLSLEKR